MHQICTEYSYLNISGHVRLPSLIQDDYRKKSNHDSDLEKRAMQLWLMMHTISMSWHKIHWFNFFFFEGTRQHLNSCIQTFFLEAKLFPVFLVRIEFWSKLHSYHRYMQLFCKLTLICKRFKFWFLADWFLCNWFIANWFSALWFWVDWVSPD